jgi:hypothetical protein
MSPLLEVIRNERSLWSEQLGDRPRDVGLNIAALLFAAVFVPWMAGLGFLDPLFVLLFACLSAFFVANLTPRAFAEGRAFAGREALRTAGATDAGCARGADYAESAGARAEARLTAPRGVNAWRARRSRQSTLQAKAVAGSSGPAST